MIASPDLRIEGVGHVYPGGFRALSDVDMDIQAGSIHALLGPSGCGKTTLLRILAGFVRPTSGRLFVGGEDVTAVPTERRGLVLVHQDQLLFPNMTVRDNVAYPLRARGLSRREARARAEEALERVQLGGLGARRPSALSGGQGQRVALARALCASPRVLLLDEPLSKLDAGLREAMRALIVDVQRQSSLTMVVVTHDRREASSLAQRVSVMSEGRVLREDTPTGLYAEPRSLAVARFLGATNFLEATFDGVRASTALGELQLSRPASEATHLCIWPEDVVLGPGPNSLHLRVVSSVFSGSQRELLLEAAGGSLRAVVPRWTEISEGAELVCHLPPERLHALIDTSDGLVHEIHSETEGE